MNTQSLVIEFLHNRRFAFIGVSRDPKSFSRVVFSEFVRQGFDPVPVNPFTADIEGKQCFAAVNLIHPPVTTAFIVMAPRDIKLRLRECCNAGISLAWLYGIKGPKELPPEVFQISEQYGMSLIAGYCPFMFFRNVPWIHRLHTSVWKLVGLYPK